MAFIISKKSKYRGTERKLYYLVMNYRDGKKIRRKAIQSLGEGENLSEALLIIKEKEKAVLIRLVKLNNRLERVNKGDLTAFYTFSPHYRQIHLIKENIKELKNELEINKKNENKLKVLIQNFPKCSINKTINNY